MVQRYDELLAKKEKLKEENLHLISVIQKITKSSEERINPSTSFVLEESVRQIEQAAQKAQAIDSWVDQIFDQCAQVVRETFQVMIKLKNDQGKSEPDF